MKQTILLITSFVFFYSCKKENSYPMAYVSKTEHEKCEKLALKKGDTLAYNTLSMEFFDSPNEGMFLYTALIMANKYNYGRAYDDAYMCLTDAYHKKSGEELDDLDSETKKLAFDLLFRGVKVKNKDCMNNLSNQYKTGKHIPKDIVRSAELEAAASR